MLLGDMNISTLMTRAQNVGGNNLTEQSKVNKKASIGNYDHSQQKLGGGNRSQGQHKFSAPALSSTSISSSKNSYDKKGTTTGSKSQGSFSGTKKRGMFWVRSIW